MDIHDLFFKNEKPVLWRYLNEKMGFFQILFGDTATVNAVVNLPFLLSFPLKYSFFI